MHTIRCFPPSPSIRLVPMPGSGNQLAYASGTATVRLPISRTNALLIQASAHVALAVSFDDGTTGYCECEPGTSMIEFGAKVTSFVTTSSGTGVATVVQPQTFDNPGGHR